MKAISLQVASCRHGNIRSQAFYQAPSRHSCCLAYTNHKRENHLNHPFGRNFAMPIPNATPHTHQLARSLAATFFRGYPKLVGAGAGIDRQSSFRLKRICQSSGRKSSVLVNSLTKLSLIKIRTAYQRPESALISQTLLILRLHCTIDTLTVERLQIAAPTGCIMLSERKIGMVARQTG